MDEEKSRELKRGQYFDKYLKIPRITKWLEPLRLLATIDKSYGGKKSYLRLFEETFFEPKSLSWLDKNDIQEKSNLSKLIVGKNARKELKEIFSVLNKEGGRRNGYKILVNLSNVLPNYQVGGELFLSLKDNPFFRIIFLNPLLLLGYSFVDENFVNEFIAEDLISSLLNGDTKLLCKIQKGLQNGTISFGWESDSSSDDEDNSLSYEEIDTLQNGKGTLVNINERYLESLKKGFIFEDAKRYLSSHIQTPGVLFKILTTRAYMRTHPDCIFGTHICKSGKKNKKISAQDIIEKLSKINFAFECLTQKEIEEYKEEFATKIVSWLKNKK